MSKKDEILSQKNEEEDKGETMKTFKDLSVGTVFIYLQDKNSARLMVKVDDECAKLIKGVDETRHYVYETPTIKIFYDGEVQKIRSIAKL